MEVRAQTGRGGARRRVLRRGQSRRRLCRRQNLLQHPRRPNRGARRRYRPGIVAHEARRHHARRDDDDGAAGRQRQGAGRQQRRRVGRAGLADRARREQRQDRLARLQHRPRQGRADRRRVQAVLRPGPGQGSRGPDLAARGLEDRRRHRVGLDHLRPGAEPDLLRHRQSRPLEPRPAPGRQQMDRRRSSPATRIPARPDGSTNGQPARSARL